MLAAVYCRVSTEKDDQINSLESQMSYFLNYIENCPDLTLFQIYADKGISGTAVKNRTRFIQMMEDADKGLFQVIITKEVSRFSRNILDAVSYSRNLRNLGVSIRFMNDGIDTSQPDAELRLSIMASLAQEESRKTSDRVKWGQTRRMEKGVVFGTSMLGYDVKNGKIAVNTDGAEIVKNIFNKYVFLHMSASEIAKELQNEGIKTYTGKEKWTPSVIIKVLKNEKYCGDLRQKKTFTPDYLTHKKKTNKCNEKTVFIKDHHAPIISRDLWEAAQQELNRRSHVKKQDSGRGNKFYFSGKIICANCGCPFSARKKKGKDGYYTIWKCLNNQCHVRYQIRNDSLMYMTAYSYSLLNIQNEKLTEHIHSLLNMAEMQLTGTSSTSLKQKKSEIEELKIKKLNIIDAYAARKISEDEFMALKSKYDSLIIHHNNEIENLQKTQSVKKLKNTTIKKYIDKIINYNNITKSIIYNCIEKVNAYENGIVKLKFCHLPQVFEFEIYFKKSKQYTT